MKEEKCCRTCPVARKASTCHMRDVPEHQRRYICRDCDKTECCKKS